MIMQAEHKTTKRETTLQSKVTLQTNAVWIVVTLSLLTAPSGFTVNHGYTWDKSTVRQDNINIINLICLYCIQLRYQQCDY